jgi:hypothetical protein
MKIVPTLKITEVNTSDWGISAVFFVISSPRTVDGMQIAYHSMSKDHEGPS